MTAVVLVFVTALATLAIDRGISWGAKRIALSRDEGFGAETRSRWLATLDHEDLLRLRNAVAAEIHRRSVT